MKHQQRSYTCGIAAASNALECIDIRKSQGALMRLGYVTPADGTDEEELKRVLLASGATVDEWSFDGEALSKDWLWHHTTRLGPAVLCVDDHGHWITCIGPCGKAWAVFDSAQGMGLRVYTWEGLKTRWRLSKRAGGHNYYGIGVAKVQL